MKATAMPDSLHIELAGQIRQFIDWRTNGSDLYNTPSEYIQDLVRRDMELTQESHAIADMLREARLSPISPLEPDFIEKERSRIRHVYMGGHTET